MLRVFSKQYLFFFHFNNLFTHLMYLFGRINDDDDDGDNDRDHIHDGGDDDHDHSRDDGVLK